MKTIADFDGGYSFGKFLNKLSEENMKTFQMNLGLNNNPMQPEEVVDYFATLKKYRLMAYYITDKTFNGEVEPTFCAMFQYFNSDSDLLKDTEGWCKEFTQESIAISTPKMEVLAFNPSYEGEAYRFDSNLFEYLKK